MKRIGWDDGIAVAALKAFIVCVLAVAIFGGHHPPAHAEERAQSAADQLQDERIHEVNTHLSATDTRVQDNWDKLNLTVRENWDKLNGKIDYLSLSEQANAVAIGSVTTELRVWASILLLAIGALFKQQWNRQKTES